MLNLRKENALIALQELLTDAKTDRPEMSNENTAIVRVGNSSKPYTLDEFYMSILEDGSNDNS